MQTTQPKEQVQIRRASGPVNFEAAPPAPQAHAQAAPASWPQASWPVASPWGATPWAAWPNEAPAFQPLPPAYGLPNPIAYGAPFVPAQASIPRFGTFAPAPAFPAIAGQAYPQATGLPAPAGLTQRVPACDLVDEGGEYVCQLELPGVKRENIDVSLFERALLVTAHYEPEIDVGALIVGERGSTVSFRRAITLPSEVSTANAKAALRDGVLTLVLPKTKPTAGPQRIPVA